MRFAESLSDKALEKAIRKLKGNTCSKALQERKLLLAERRYRRKNYPKSAWQKQKERQNSYPCKNCKEVCPFDIGQSCEKFDNWHGQKARS